MTVTIDLNDSTCPVTAHLCLYIAAEYARAHGLVILSERDETGKVLYWFEKRSRHDHK